MRIFSLGRQSPQILKDHRPPLPANPTDLLLTPFYLESWDLSGCSGPDSLSTVAGEKEDTPCVLGRHLLALCHPLFPTGSSQPLAKQLVPICGASSSPGSEEGGCPLPCGERPDWDPGEVRRGRRSRWAAKLPGRWGHRQHRALESGLAFPLAARNANMRVAQVKEQTPQARKAGGSQAPAPLTPAQAQSAAGWHLLNRGRAAGMERGQEP